VSDLSPADFDFVAGLLKSSSGLSLSPAKTYLLDSRVTPLLRRYGLRTTRDFVTALRTDEKGTMLTELSEAMATYETYFYRDISPFESLQTRVLPKLREIRQGQRRLRIWSAACSTGQEPYSLAMMFEEEKHLWAGWSIEILATDVSTTALTRAREGIYSQFEVQRGLPIRNLMAFFVQEGDQWRVKPQLKKWLRFEQVNLLQPLTQLGTFDIILCRNALIYFDAETKSRVLGHLADVISPDGVLVMGSAETTLHYSDLFTLHPDDRTLYVPKKNNASLTGLQSRPWPQSKAQPL
jgi:chemotaxis protein methyltransferase CheR